MPRINIDTADAEYIYVIPDSYRRFDPAVAVEVSEEFLARYDAVHKEMGECNAVLWKLYQESQDKRRENQEKIAKAETQKRREEKNRQRMKKDVAT